MRKLSSFILSLSILLAHLGSIAQNYNFRPQTASPFSLQSSGNSQIDMQYQMQGFALEAEQVKGESMQRLVLTGSPNIPGPAGMPDLPLINKNIALPQGATPTLSISIKDSLVLHNINIAPNIRIPLDTEVDFPIEKGAAYQSDSWYPQKLQHIETTEIRGLRVARLQFCPFQYNPVSKTLKVYKNIELKLHWQDNKASYIEERFRSPYWDVLLQDYIANYKDIPSIDYNHRRYNSKTDGCEYLIVIPDKPIYHQWADSLKTFRNEQGIHTRVLTTTEAGGNTIAGLNSFFEQVYNTWSPVPAAVLLMADYAQDDSGITAKSWSHPNEGIYISDNYYADVTGNHLPDFVFARMTANNAKELETMVTKCIHYEKNPPREAAFYNKPITALGWQTERWFQLCSETVGGYMRHKQGKQPVRINAVYKGNPASDPWSTASNTGSVLNAFGPAGLNYIPATPSELGGWTGGTANDVTEALNQGAFMLMHRDHGNYVGWGEPGFGSSNVRQLHNADKLSHIFSINCLTGQFDIAPASFAELMHRHDKGGALSLTAATQVSYSFVNDALVWGMFDNMWPDFLPDYGNSNVAERDFLPAFGLASGKYYLSTNNWASSYYKTITYRLFHHHGDAFNTVYYNMPQQNNILHDTYITTNTSSIQVEAEKGSLVGLSHNGTLLAAARIPDSGHATLNFPAQTVGTKLKIVITKQNYLRYEQLIETVAANVPFLCINKLKYHDANGNDSIENGETVNISLWIKNIGTEDITAPINILLSSADANISITQANHTAAALAAGTAIELNAVLKFSPSNTIEDLYQLPLSIQLSSQGFSKTFDYSTTIYAPKLHWSTISFEEVANGNGNSYIDPGEEVIARFSISNQGHAKFPAGQLSIGPNSDLINLTHSPQAFDLLHVGDSIYAQCNISSQASVPMYSTASILSTIDASPFHLQDKMYFSIGQIIEDWETQDFNRFPWHREGDKEWEISSRFKYDGSYSACSPKIDHNQSASLILHYNCIDDGYVSFYMMISSEFNSDFLSFYIDDVLQDKWSKIVLFTSGPKRFAVSAGQHTFRWTYAKDAEGQLGADQCWIDHIVLPAGSAYESIAEENATTEEAFTVFPNPATDHISIQLTQGNTPHHIELWNSLGQQQTSLSMPQQQINISTANMAPGIYFIRLLNQHKQVVQSKKILIIR